MGIINFLKKLLGKSVNQQPKEFTDKEYELDYQQKSEALENVLGKMHNLVGHAIIPFAVGGAVDMYYFPNHMKGTGFATMELLEPDGTGPLPNRQGTYELVAFTKYNYVSSDDPNTPFNRIERKICGIFTKVGFFSRQAVLNSGETCEVPNKEGEENTCLIFDLYDQSNIKFKIGNRQHHLLLCIQVFRSELDYARLKGTWYLLEKLKNAGHYPYSDLDRNPVV